MWETFCWEVRCLCWKRHKGRWLRINSPSSDQTYSRCVHVAVFQHSTLRLTCRLNHLVLGLIRRTPEDRLLEAGLVCVWFLNVCLNCWCMLNFKQGVLQITENSYLMLTLTMLFVLWEMRGADLLLFLMFFYCYGTHFVQFFIIIIWSQSNHAHSAQYQWSIDIVHWTVRQRLWSHPTCWRYINESIIIIIIIIVHCEHG